MPGVRRHLGTSKVSQCKKGNTMNEQLSRVYGEDPLQDREILLEDSMQTILRIYHEAITDGKRDPIVLLLECKDEIGSHIAKRFIPASVVDRQVASKPLPTQPVPVC